MGYLWWIKKNFKKIQDHCEYIQVKENFDRNGFVIIRVMPVEYIINYLKDHPDERTVYVPYYLIRNRYVYQKDLIF